jgi:hypothetical protein
MSLSSRTPYQKLLGHSCRIAFEVEKGVEVQHSAYQKEPGRLVTVVVCTGKRVLRRESRPEHQNKNNIRLNEKIDQSVRKKYPIRKAL